MRRSAGPEGATLQTAAWHDFFISIAGASASLLGLLFVGLSLNLKAVRARRDILALSRQTYMDLSRALFLCLLILWPGLTAYTLGIAWLVLGGMGLSSMLHTLREGWSHVGRTVDRVTFLRRFGGSGLAVIGLVAGGCWSLIAHESANLLAAAAIASIAFLLLALRNIWDLLLAVGAEEEQAEAAERAEGASAVPVADHE